MITRKATIQLVHSFVFKSINFISLLVIADSMGRIVPPFRQLYQETISELQMELKAALVDLGHKSAFDLLLKEAWNPEVAALGNSRISLINFNSLGWPF